MKKYLILICLFILAIQLLVGQELAFMSGMNLNHYYKNLRSSDRVSTHYDNQVGFHLGLNLKFDKRNPKDILARNFYFSYDYCQAIIQEGDGGLGDSYSSKLAIKHHLLAFSLFPLDVNIKDRVRINVGAEASYLVGSKIEGYYRQWDIGGTNTTKEIGPDEKHIQRRLKSGIIASIKCSLPLHQTIVIVPQYTVRYSLSSEFKEYFPNTNNILHRMLIGIRIDI